MPQPGSVNIIGFPFVELQSVDSTNNYARKLLHEGLARHGLAIFAHEQVQGKGRRGKTWVAEKDANIILSTIINPAPLRIAQQFQLNACVAVGVHKFFSEYAGIDTRIKWPNDLYWQDRKAGGILIESVVGTGSPESDRWQWAIVGTGININQTLFASRLRNPVSLKQITGKHYDPLFMAKELCAVFEKFFLQLKEKGFENIYTQYLNILYKKNETVKLRKKNRVFEAEIIGVSRKGKLITKHSTEEEFDFDEIEWLL